MPIAEGTLRELVALARITPSGMNAQPLRYMLSCEPGMNDRIFGTLSWAGSLKDWDGPEPGEQPTGYIVVLIDKAINPNAAHDVGIACQTILLGATERGLGGCMVASVRRKELAEIMEISDGHAIALVLALGTPAEHVVLEEIDFDASVKYYREPDGTHHVPKRKLDDLILRSFR